MTQLRRSSCSSFADYQRNFGGFFYSPWQPNYVGQAVYQFFLNGGPTCYVVGLPAQEYLSGGEPIPPSLGPVEVVAASVNVSFGADSITFTALQPVGVPGRGSRDLGGNPDAGGVL